MAQQRAHGPKKLAGEPTARLVFVDESGANTQMTRWGGRRPVGERLVPQRPPGHDQTSPRIAAGRLSGAEAPRLFSGALDGALFWAWGRQGLGPPLQPEDRVILDNLAPPKGAGVREAMEAAGARLRYLPPYSPDFHPIENLWSKVKQRLRSLAPRTDKQLLQAFGTALWAVSVADCHGFFLNAQYAI